MELQVLDDPILCNSHILVIFVVKRCLLFFRSKLRRSILYIFIFDLNDILLVFIDNAQQLPFNLDEVLRGVAFTEVEHLLLEYQI